MDITKAKRKVFTTKLFNGETVNYSLCFFAASFLLIALKQLFKYTLSLSAPLSVGISAVICAAVLFFLESKFVFYDGKNKSTAKRIVFYLFRCAVDFGLYKIAAFTFTSMLKLNSAFTFLMAGIVIYVFNYYFGRLLIFDCTKSPERKKNGRAYRMFFENRFIVLAVALATVTAAFVFIIDSLFPFGNITVLRMDLFHQYGPLFVELFDRVTQHKSFLFSWTAGGGMSFLGNYFNYLSSPLSFIILLFDRKDMPYTITILMYVKAVLSAASFTYYIKKSLNRHSYLSACFGVFYAFSAYFLAYFWNIMWLDGMFLFPLVVLGIERLINDKKPLTYIASLTVLLYSSYYMGYMTCLFSVVYFILYYFYKSDKDNPAVSLKAPADKKDKFYSFKVLGKSKLINRGLLFAGSSLLCGLLCAASLMPVYFILQGSSATSDSFPSDFKAYFDLIDIISSHFAVLETTIRSSGNDILPNVYCGILTIILLPLYIANKDIRIKEKTFYVFLIVFFIFSFNNNWANFIWHAFHFPNDLPYRFSFMYSFVLLVVAFRALIHFKSIEYRDLAMAGMIWGLVVIIIQKNPTEKMMSATTYLTLVLIVMWTAVLLLIKKGMLSKFVLSIIAVAVSFCEVMVAFTCCYGFSCPYDEFTKNYDTYIEEVNYIKDTDKGFYRSELTELNTYMDACVYGYNGISAFTSMAYETYSQNQYALGMKSNRINSYIYHTQTPVYNAMYGIKYLYKSVESLTPSAEFYKEIYTDKDADSGIYENKYTLPIAFLTKSDIKDWVNEEGNPFEVQSDFIEKATGTSGIFIPAEYTSTVGDEVDCDEVLENGTCFFTKDDAESDSGSIDVTIKTVRDGNLYVYVSSPDIENLNFYWNDDEDSVSQNISEPYIIDLGSHKKGDEITLNLDCSEIDTDSSYFDIFAYNIDSDKFKAAYELMSLGGYNIDAFTETKLSGSIDAGYDGYIYTSIPYDKGWSVYIDGKKTSTFDIGGCQLGAKITAGKHRVEFRFSPTGFKEGVIIAVASYAGVFLYLLYRRINRKKE